MITLLSLQSGHLLITPLLNNTACCITWCSLHVHVGFSVIIIVISKLLQAIRTGVHDVLPPYTLDTLSAETMRLLLCGCQQVDLDTLKKITMFSDESSESP